MKVTAKEVKDKQIFIPFCLELLIESQEEVDLIDIMYEIFNEKGFNEGWAFMDALRTAIQIRGSKK